MKAIVLAAGRGTRLGPVTRMRAKPLAPILDQPIIKRILAQLAAIGVTRAYVNLHYGGDTIMREIGERPFGKIEVVYRHQATLTGPAGGAALFAEDVADQKDVLVVSGDAFHEIDLATMRRQHLNTRARLTVAMKQVSNPERFGVGRARADGEIVAFEEKPALREADSGLVSCGIYCLEPSLLNEIPLNRVYDFGRDLIPKMADEGGLVYAYHTDAWWTDIGRPSDLLVANLREVEVRCRSEGAGILGMSTASVTNDANLLGPVFLGVGARIEAGCVVVGPAVIGSGCVLGAGTEVHQSVLLPGTELPPHMFLVGGLAGSYAGFEL